MGKQSNGLEAAGPRQRGRRSLGRPQAVSVGQHQQSGAANWQLPTGVASITVSATRQQAAGPLFSLAAASRGGKGGKGASQATAAPRPSTLHLLLNRPLALLSLVPPELATFFAGGVAGAIAKTTTAPLDRVSCPWCGVAHLTRCWASRTRHPGAPTVCHLTPCCTACVPR